MDTINQFRRTAGYENYYLDAPTLFTLNSSSVLHPGDTTTELFVGYELLIPRPSTVDIYLYSGFNSQNGLQTDPDLSVYLETQSAGGSTFAGANGVTRYLNAGAYSFFLGDDYATVTTTFANQRVLVVAERSIFITIGWSNTGPFTFSATATPTPASSNGVPDSADVTGQWTLIGDKASLISKAEDANSSDSAAQFGGSSASATEPVVLWHQIDSKPAGAVVSSFTMSLEPGDAAGDDQFAWQVSDPSGEPLMALWVNAADGTLRAVQPDGITTTSIQHITPGGGAHRFEIIVDPAAGTWITIMDGVPVTEAIKLPAGAKFGDISAVWDLGADGVSSGASIIFDDFRVEAEVAP